MESFRTSTIFSAPALSGLDAVFEEQRKYFDKVIVINDLVNSDLVSKLDERERVELLEFKEVCIKLLERAAQQARERLERLKKALDQGEVVVQGGVCTLRVAPMGETWFVSATRQFGWLFHLTIHGVSARGVFPDMLKLPKDALEQLQSGWRASDETVSLRKPSMGTARPAQLIAWAATRPGGLRIRITKVSLNKYAPTIHWDARALNWYQQWASKDGARDLALRTPLGLLTLYLGARGARKLKPLPGH